MKNRGSRLLGMGILMLVLFAVWTALIQNVDVCSAGETSTAVGFATMNVWVHGLTGVHMQIYAITDWLGLVPVLVCLLFGIFGFLQMIRKRSLLKVDLDIIILGIYYLFVIMGYFIFEMIPINYRPVFIEGRLEASYPSSTTLLVLSVMPTLVFQANRRLKKAKLKNTIGILSVGYSMFMVIARLISGVHWFTDIIGSVFLSLGLFCMYKAVILMIYKENREVRDGTV